MSGEESDLNISDESDDEETIDVEESYETRVCGQCGQFLLHSLVANWVNIVF